MSNWNKVFKPIVVLCVICVVVTGALAATNSVTEPIIKAATIAAQTAARKELLPEADDFTKVEGLSVANVVEAYTANNGVGAVVTSTAKGYGGEMTVMVAFTPEGTIKQIKVTEQGETQGIGSKVAKDPNFWTRFQGLEAKTLVLGTDVDGLTGATVSSKALTAAVNAAIDGYNAIN